MAASSRRELRLVKGVSRSTRIWHKTAAGPWFHRIVVCLCYTVKDLLLATERIAIGTKLFQLSCCH
jgi:hypothetical protein